jgi:hypothetical protein
MDADDLMYPSRLEVQMSFILRNPGVVFLGSSYAFLTPFGHIFELPSLGAREVSKEEVAGRRGFPDSSLVFNRLAALTAGGVDREFSKCDGLPLMFRLLTQGKAWGLADHLQLYRLRPNSLSKDRDHDAESRQIHFKYAPEFFDPKPTNTTPQSFWKMIAKLEMLSGDTETIGRAVELMRREGDFDAQTNRFPFNNFAGALGRTYYKLRYGAGYRHRPDLEKLFSPLLKKSPFFSQQL